MSKGGTKGLSPNTRSQKPASKLVAVPNIPLGPRANATSTPTTPPSQQSSLTVLTSTSRSSSGSSNGLPSWPSSQLSGTSAEPAFKPTLLTLPRKDRNRYAAETKRIVANTATQQHIRPDETSTDTPEHVQWEYDVYAKPFVPSVFSQINTEPPVNIISTALRHQVDFEEYAASFVGKAFLPDRPTIAPEKDVAKPALPPDKALTEQSYLHHLTALFRIESAAKEKENEEYALYKILLGAMPTNDGEPLWALSIPGLREDSPLVEMGDVLQLRQLLVDPTGNLVQIPVQMTDPGFGQVRIEYKSWAGIQYNACVYGVNRAEETVYLRIEGFLPSHKLDPTPRVVNVVFPLKQRRVHDLRRALMCVNSELRKTMCPLYHPPVSSIGSGSDSDDFNEAPGVKYTPKGVPERRVCAPHNDWILRMLFPKETHAIMQTELRSVPHREFFDADINYEQAHAVNAIHKNNYGTLPYLISGPPGTGKTKTLVETAMQLLNSTNVAHMLICAPSEAAADTLALRLKKYLSPKQLLRLNGPGRADNEVPKELTQYCYMEHDMFYIPPLKTMMSFNVVVTSCRDAALLAEARLSNNDLWEIEKSITSAIHPEDPVPVPTLHWGALLVDEAAQATEFDVLPAISAICPPSAYPTNLPQPRFVMAGDEHQLGPRTASRDPQFSTSLFARLFARPLYAHHPLSRATARLKQAMLPFATPPFTNLLRNYRSHPAILSIPSSLYYADTLLPEAPTPTTPLQSSPLWPRPGWPILFIPHTGPDEIERDGAGWYNDSEARIACSIAQSLVSSSGVTQSEICIMSPFAAQVRRLRALIRSRAYGAGQGLWDVNIGPLEAFQGLERRVVILCTTRTRARFLEQDRVRGLGVVAQPRRLNVALTRAKEGLVVLGNPGVLAQDADWRVWLAFVARNGLVRDSLGVWREKGVLAREGKVGALERALVAKEQAGRMRMRALGASVVSQVVGGEEDWVRDLRDTLEEEEAEAEAELEEEEFGEYGEEGGEGEGLDGVAELEG